MSEFRYPQNLTVGFQNFHIFATKRTKVRKNLSNLTDLQAVSSELDQIEDVSTQQSFTVSGEYYTAESEAEIHPTNDDPEPMSIAYEPENEIDVETAQMETSEPTGSPMTQSPATVNQEGTSPDIGSADTDPVEEPPIFNPWNDIDPTFLVAIPAEDRRNIYSRICDDVRQGTQTLYFIFFLLYLKYYQATYISRLIVQF